jgi:DNA polymerase delta subunit 2
MLEDESGRIKLTGPKIKEAQLVTGVIVGALGLETPDGDFEVVDICYPGMPPMMEPIESQVSDDAMDVDDGEPVLIPVHVNSSLILLTSLTVKQRTEQAPNG